MGKRCQTETIDRLFLELSQFTSATTARELALKDENKRLRGVLAQSIKALQSVRTGDDAEVRCWDMAERLRQVLEPDPSSPEAGREGAGG